VTNPVRPGFGSDDPLLQAIAEHWADIERRADPRQRQLLADLVAGTTQLEPDEARAALADELLDILPPDHPVSQILRSGTMYSPAPVRPAGASMGVDRHIDSVTTWLAGAGAMPVTIYLSDEAGHAQVERAVEELLATAGLRITDRAEPVFGSWFRRMTARAQQGLQSPMAQDAALTGVHAADSRLVLAQDAEVTARLLQNLAPVIGSLQPTKDAVLRVGALLIVKVDWAVSVFQLTAAQQARLDHHPQLASTPREIVAALQLASKETAIEGAP
jgi:hypothetical protein